MDNQKLDNAIFPFFSKLYARQKRDRTELN